MNILAFDTCLDACSAAVGADDAEHLAGFHKEGDVASSDEVAGGGVPGAHHRSSGDAAGVPPSSRRTGTTRMRRWVMPWSTVAATAAPPVGIRAIRRACSTAGPTA